MTVPEKRASGAVAAVLALLTAGALMLRLFGIDYMLPYQLEPDHGVVGTAAWLEKPEGVEEPWARPSPIYPRLMPRILQLLPGRSYPRILPSDAPLAEHLAAASEPFVRMRILAAFLSALAIPLVYFVARAVLGRGASLLAAALLAASVLLQNYGQQGRAHGGVAGLSVLAMVFAVAIPRAPTWKNYAAVGVASGLALGCLQTGVFALPALAVAHFLAPRPRKLAPVLVALGLIALAAAPFYPTIHMLVPLKQEGTFSVGITERLRTLSPAWEGLKGIPASLFGSEPVITVAALLGGACALVRLSRKPRPARERIAPFLVCATFVGCLLVFWATLFPFRPRYLTSLVPFLAVLGAYGAREASRRLLRSVPSEAARVRASVVLALLLLALPLWTCVRLCWLRCRPDTTELAARWIAEKGDPKQDELTLGLLFDLPLREGRAGIERVPELLRSHWQRYQLRVAGEATDAWTIHPLTLRELMADRRLSETKVAAELARANATYTVIADRGPEAREMDDTPAAARKLYGAPLARFPQQAAWAEGGPYPAYDLGPDALRVILSAECWGFPVEVYGRSGGGR